MLSLLSLLVSPLLSGIGSIFSSLFSSKAQVETASITGMAQVESKWWYLPLLTIVPFSIPFEIWTFKAVAWDKVIAPAFGYHHAVTDPLTGALAVAYSLVITGVFLKATFS